MNPARGLCFVRPVKTAETLAGGKIVLLQDTRESWTGQQAEVVAVGEPEICKDEDCERAHHTMHADGFVCRLGPSYHWPLNFKPGDWVLVTPRSFVAIGDPEDRLWAIPQDCVLAVLEP